MGQSAFPEDVAHSFWPTDDEVEQNFANRERYERDDGLESLDGSFESSLPPAISAIADTAIEALISPEAHDLILSFEVAGKSGYEKRYKCPCWPKGASGITIGLGYDIGYNSPADFEKAWKALLPEPDFVQLARTVGVKGTAAAGLLGPVRSIVVPWEAAEQVYRTVTVPRFARLVLATYPNSEKLHPHSFGALLSLVYNRGSALSGARRIHMRNIRDHLSTDNLTQIPHELRAMKVLWGPSMSGLHKRRDAEARLFEQGLIEVDKLKALQPAVLASAPAAVASAMATAGASLAVATAGAAAAGAPAASTAGGLEALRSAGSPGPDDEGDGRDWPDDLLESVDTAPTDGDLEATRPEWAAVAWVDVDDNSTEYRHILAEDRGLKDLPFTFTAADLELLIRANSFDPLRTEGKIIFGLRGTLLEGTAAAPDDRFAQVDRQSLQLKEVRPDHRTLRCVIGVYDLATQRLSAFTASTVPNRAAVASYHATRKSGNMLPTGCYRYVVGAHSKGRYQGCLRQDEPFAVLRSPGNPKYDVKDDFDPGLPMDNIHPAFADRSAEFSSWGCQVIRGGVDPGSRAYTHEWAKFRAALGLAKPGAGDHGRKFSYVLLTGLDASIAARLREQGKASDFVTVEKSLVRLRQGSHGAFVSRLRSALALPADGVLDAAARKALADRQKRDLGWGDGVYSPAMDQALNLFILRPEPVVVAALQPAAGAATTLESMGGGGLDPLESLYLELGRRARAAGTYPEALGLPELPYYESLDQESLGELIAFGKSAFARVERSAHELICGDGATDQDQRQQLQDALGQVSGLGIDQVTDVLASVLATTLFLVPPINRIVAKIIVERIVAPTFTDAQQRLAPTLTLACRNWALDIHQRHAAAGAVTGAAASPAAQLADA